MTNRVILNLMKTILRAVFLNIATLFIVSHFYQGLSIKSDIKTFVSAAVVWWLLNKIIKPIIKLLLLPINLITLGLFSWAVNAITIFLLQMVIKDVAITAYTFPGFVYQGFIVPTILFNLLFSYIITSFILYITHAILVWMMKS